MICECVIKTFQKNNKIKEQIDGLIEKFDIDNKERMKNDSYYERRSNMRRDAIEEAKKKYNLHKEDVKILNAYYDLYSQ